MQKEVLLHNIAAHVKNLFRYHNFPYLLYHNLAHTLLVVQHAAEIAGYYSMDEETKFCIQAAAWFHDTGHLIGPMDIHEENGIRLMLEYLKERDINGALTDKISDYIMATKMPTNPHTLPEAILCDADTYHLGTPDFLKIDNLVWKEMELRTQTKIAGKTGKTLAFLRYHRYYTSYCNNLLNAGKQKNVDIIQSLLIDE